jgi:orotate phosphoribosyltransferase
LIGAPLQGKVLIVDDVLSAGTSVAESMAMIDAHGAKAAGVVVALDRMEKGKGETLARIEVAEKFGIPVYAIMTLAEIMAILEEEGQSDLVKRIKDYLKRHGS